MSGGIEAQICSSVGKSPSVIANQGDQAPNQRKLRVNEAVTRGNVIGRPRGVIDVTDEASERAFAC